VLPILEDAVKAFSSFKDFLRENKSHSLVPEPHIPASSQKSINLRENPACILRLPLDL